MEIYNISVFPRFPIQRYRRPINRRIGNANISGIRRGRFDVKKVNINAKPKPNLAKYPGNVNYES